MAHKYIVALDQGTTSCRAVVFDRSAGIVNLSQKEFTQYYPQSGWVEHDPEEIWSIQLEMMKEAVSGIDPQEIAAIGITNQRETVVVWDRLSGKPLHRAIVWQCRRSNAICDQLKSSGWEQTIRSKTGLVLDPYFSGTKLMWLLDHHPEIREKAEKGEALFGTVDSWLIWNLTAGKVHATDYSNASRTMLYNIHSLQWDEEILTAFRIPRQMLPKVLPSSHIYGYTKLLGGGDPIPIAGAAGDQHAALFGNACNRSGMAKSTYGTGCFVLMNTGDKPVESSQGLLTTIAWGLAEGVQYAIEGSVFIGGAAIQWLRDGLELIENAAESEALANSVEDTNGVYFVPAFTGLGTPYWKPDARGLITGLTRGTTKAHLVRAALEAIAYQCSDVLKVMEKESGIKLDHLKVDGGAANNNFLLKFQAELLGIPVIRPKVTETTAQGAAFFAGLATGFWESVEELQQLWQYDASFIPGRDQSYREDRCEGWRRAVQLLV